MLRDDGHRDARDAQATGSTKSFALTLWIIKMTSFFPLSSDIISSVWAVNGSLPSLATAETNACVKVCMFLFFVKPSERFRQGECESTQKAKGIQRGPRKEGGWEGVG
jgi:hypothetical protein